MLAQPLQMAGARLARAPIWTPVLSNDLARERKVHGSFHRSQEFREAVKLLEIANGSPTPSACCGEI